MSEANIFMHESCQSPAGPSARETGLPRADGHFVVSLVADGSVRIFEIKPQSCVHEAIQI